jgi:hypothetical protein
VMLVVVELALFDLLKIISEVNGMNARSYKGIDRLGGA